MRLARIASAALALLLAAGAARAAFLETGWGARAPGMGDAFTPLADDAYAAFYNPAGLGQLERPELGLSYAQLYTGLSDGTNLGSSQLAYAMPFARGRSGTAALSWDRFQASGLYQEESLGLSYGRRVKRAADGGELLVGGTARYLSRSFTGQPEAQSACSGLSCGLGADPVLTGKTRVSAYDADIGVLYRLPRLFQVGFAVDHALQPNVGFAENDRLGRAYRAGVAYRSLWTSFSGEARLTPAPDGTVDRDLLIGGERTFASLDYGQFAVRGGLGVGSREWRQVTVGGTYRAAKLQFDYAYLLPVGAVRGQSGTHRFGIMVRFGSPTTEEELGRELLERARRVSGEPIAVSTSAAPADGAIDLDDRALAGARASAAARRYGEARSAFVSATRRRTTKPAAARFGRRVALVASYFDDLSAPADKARAVLAAGADKLVKGDDASAMNELSYALSLAPRDPKVARFAEDAQKETGLPLEKPGDGSRDLFTDLLYRAEAAFNRGDAPAAERALQEAAALEPADPTPLERLGSLRYVAGKPAEAAAYWERAQAMETRPGELRSLAEYLSRARAAAAPAASAAPALVPPPSAAAGPSSDPRDVAALYQKAIESYARGEQLQATALFLRILELDPNNEAARRALERLARTRAAGDGR